MPFLALALLREAEVRTLLRESARQLAGRPWGVGILGFVPPELRAEQLAVVREFRPQFALFAGGRPDQAAGLEREGIATYLHVPSPGLLDQYLRDGSRRFVLEGRECGGHVGPRSSFVLWEQAVTVVGEALDRGIAAARGEPRLRRRDPRRSLGCAGRRARGPAGRPRRQGGNPGRDRLSVHTRSGRDRGDRVAVSGRSRSLRGDGSARVGARPPGSGEPNAVRRPIRGGEESGCWPSGDRPRKFATPSKALNVGRLRVATKGLDRSQGAGSPLQPVSDEYQATHGLFMLGQVAALRTGTTTIEELHRELCTGSTELLERHDLDVDPSNGADKPRPSDIAIVGMAAVFPGASSVSRFWSNTLRGFDAITEVPPDRWDWRLYYDADPKAPDKIVSKWGGFLPDVAFDPIRYGMPPRVSARSSRRNCWHSKWSGPRSPTPDTPNGRFPARRPAWCSAWEAGRPSSRWAMPFVPTCPCSIRCCRRAASRRSRRARGCCPNGPKTRFRDSCLNVTAGRIANRLNLGGANYTVDAACGSSLAAASLAVRELETGAADMVILGGVDTVQNPFTYLAFSKTQAFSPRGRCRPFDASADGIVISEGVAAVVLKRLADAERDGDRIYAVIKGVGASSDGRARGLTAPVVEGQMRALERAYAKAGDFTGHGRLRGGARHGHRPGRRRRDRGAQPAIPGKPGANRRECIVGSVKSMIGHTKCAAGLAGLINASLALVSQRLAADDRSREPQPQARLERRPAPALHPEPALASSPPGPAAPRRRECIRVWRHQLPRRPRGVRSQRGRGSPSRR